MAGNGARFFDAATQNGLAQKLKALHKPGDPIIFANAWDPYVAKMVASDARSKAVATASYAIAESRGYADPELTLDLNLEVASSIIQAVHKVAPGKPVTCDLQDGYGDIPTTVKRAINIGAVGANIEDSVANDFKMRDVDDAVARIKAVLQAAKDNGVPDFVVNARTDAMLGGLTIDDVIARGKAFLAAGATTVFVWGGPTRGLRDEEIKRITTELGGRVSCSAKVGQPGTLSTKELGEIGVARISIGPGLWFGAMAFVKQGLDGVFGK